MLGHVTAGTPARRARAFSPGMRVRLTISRAMSAFSLFLRPGLGRFGASHGVDRDTDHGESQCPTTLVVGILIPACSSSPTQRILCHQVGPFLNLILFKNSLIGRLFGRYHLVG